MSKPETAGEFAPLESLLHTLSVCDLHEGNCASLEIASRRVRNLGNRGLTYLREATARTQALAAQVEELRGRLQDSQTAYRDVEQAHREAEAALAQSLAPEQQAAAAEDIVMGWPDIQEYGQTGITILIAEVFAVMQKHAGRKG